MIDQSFAKIVDALAQRTPTPGGGAAAALAASMGTALLLMVVRFSRGKKANLERDQDLARVEGLLESHLLRLLPMAERDCNSFDLVSKAYAMPKGTDGEIQIRVVETQFVHGGGRGSGFGQNLTHFGPGVRLCSSGVETNFSTPSAPIV